MSPANKTLSELERLPRGRHGLTREQVAEQQRNRILAATVDVVADRGYPDTRVVDIIRAAGVSRKTFYELFDDKEECFLAAFDVAAGLLLKVTRTRFEASMQVPWAERVTMGLAGFLTLLAERPSAAKFCLVEVLAAGPKALARRDAAMRRFTEFIEAGRGETATELPPITSLALVGGVYELLYSEILHGATAQLPDRLPELVFWITQPYLGTKAAAAERDRARELLKAPTPAMLGRASIPPPSPRGMQS